MCPSLLPPHVSLSPPCALLLAMPIDETTSPPFLHMPLDFKELERVGIDADLVALTGSEPIPTACEVVAEVRMIR